MKRRLLTFAVVTACEALALAAAGWLIDRHIANVSDRIEEAYR